MKRILITGSRSWTNWQKIRDALKILHADHPAAVLVHGGAYGADCIAAAMWQHAGGKVEMHRAAWQTLGQSAGVIRNQEMVDAGADVCLAFIKDGSPGATHCADAAEKSGIETIRYTEEGP